VIAGFGCERGIGADPIRDVVREVLADHDFGAEDLKQLVTIDLKRDEEGLLEAADRLGVDLEFFSAEQLSTITPPNPNPTVKDAVGVVGVAETAALLASGADELLREKSVFRPESRAMTVALAVDQSTNLEHEE
jgi:cobalt-precorrin 5A hydrolase